MKASCHFVLLAHKIYPADVRGGKRNVMSNYSMQNKECELSLISSGLPRVLYLQ